MYINIKIEADDGEIRHLPVNTSKITYLDFKNIRNPEAGTILFMSNNKNIETPETLDVVFRKMKEAQSEFAGIIMVSAITEMMSEELFNFLVSQKEKKPRKKPATTRTRSKRS